MVSSSCGRGVLEKAVESLIPHTDQRAVAVGWVSWSHDSKHVVFVRKVNTWRIMFSPAGGSARGEETADLWAIPAGGGKATKLAPIISGRHTRGGVPTVSTPRAACSPTEPLVLYLRRQYGQAHEYQLRVVGLDGKRDRLLWDGDCGRWRWSPHGKRVLFHDESRGREQWRWCVIPAQGGPVLDISAALRKAAGYPKANMGSVQDPRWGKAGDALWCVDGPPGGKSLDLWRIDLPSLRVTRVSTHPRHLDDKILPAIRDKLAPGEADMFTGRTREAAVWEQVRQWEIYGRGTTVAAASPDGSAIAVGKTVGAAGGKKAGAYLYVCSPDGKERKLIWSEMSDLK
jgi:hypothetical protein